MKQRRLVRSAGLVLVAAFGLIVAGAPHGLAVQSGGIGGRPANPDPKNPRTESIFIYTIKPGQEKDDKVLVNNNSSTKQTISLYPVDGVATNTGSYTCKQESEATQDAGAWIALDKKEVTLDAGEKQTVDFTVTAPDNADVGEHSACIVFENKQDEGEARGGVRIRTRQAIRVVATVPGDLKRDISITNFGVGDKNNIQQYSLSLKNQGNVSADVNTSVTLDTLFGQSVYKNGGVYPVLRNEKLELVFDNSEPPFWGGWYTARASIQYDRRAGTFGVDDTSNLLTKYSEPIKIFVQPSPTASVIYLIAALVIIGLLSWLVARKLNKRRQQRTWQTYIVQDGDTIESVASRHGASWKKLAKVNDLKPPYSLIAGTPLKVPAAKETPRKDV